MGGSSSDREKVFSSIQNQSKLLKNTNETARRQYEINEWTSSNKMDTLFFYQLLLITLSIIAPLLYMHKINLLPSTAFYGISGILGIAVVLTLIVRAQYTYSTRDLRYWNRRRYPQTAPPTAVSCDAIMGQIDEASAAYTAASLSVQDTIKSTMS